MHTGDDLIAARDYVTTAAVHLDAIRAIQNEDAEVVMTALAELAKGAGRLNARGIHRSVKDLISAFESEVSKPVISHKIHSLENIISQYVAGLEEIAPSKAQSLGPALMEDLDKVRQTLKPLIKFVDTPAQAKALQTLIAFDGSQVDEEIDGVSLESILPTVTDLILSAARRTGKSISVSYDTHAVMLPNIMALDLQNFMIELGERLVAKSVELPLRRQAAGLPSSAALNLSTSERAGVLRLNVEVSGKAIEESDLGLTSLSPLMQRGASFSVHNEEGGVVARLSGLRLHASQDEILRRAAYEVAE